MVDRRINSLLGGVTRSIGPTDQDIRALQKRREHSEKMLRKDPQQPFADLLDGQGDEDGGGQDEAPSEAAGEPAKPLPKGPVRRHPKGRLIRG